MLRECTSQWDNVRVESFSGLLVDYARDCGAQAVLRGIRAVSDYEYELQMAWMNRKLDPSLETVFMMPAGAYSYLSSRLVREIASLGGTLEGLIPASVETRLRARLGDRPADSQINFCSSGQQSSGHNTHRNRKGIPVSSNRRSYRIYGAHWPHRNFGHHGHQQRSNHAAFARRGPGGFRRGRAALRHP